MSKGLSFAEARELQQLFGKGKILRPEQAQQNEQNAYMSEWGEIWNVRNDFFKAALMGGQPLTPETLDACEKLAMDCKRRQLVDLAEMVRACGAPVNPGVRFCAAVLGVEMPEAKLDTATNTTVVNLHG